MDAVHTAMVAAISAGVTIKQSKASNGEILVEASKGDKHVSLVISAGSATLMASTINNLAARVS